MGPASPNGHGIHVLRIHPYTFGITSAHVLLTVHSQLFLAFRLLQEVDLDVARLLGEFSRMDDVLLVSVKRLQKRLSVLEAENGLMPILPQPVAA